MSVQLRLLHIIDSLQKGGAERLLVDCISEIHASHPHIKQYVYTLYRSENELALPEGIVRLNIDFNKYNLLLVIWKLNAFLKANKIDIIHAHLVDSILLSRLLTVNSLTKKIFSYHNFYYDKKKYGYFSAWRMFAEKITYNKKDISIYVSEEIKQSVESVRYNNGAGFVLDNFPNPSFYYNYSLKETLEFKAIIVANLRKTKNLDLAVEELLLLKDHPVSIDIYGEGPLRKSLQGKINTTNVNLTLKGSQLITSELLNNYDVFLMTSESEGLPVSLLESMTTGLPSILPDHLPIFKKVANESAIFYSIKEKGDLSEKIKSILHDKNQLMQLSLVSKENAKPYRLENYINALMSIYKISH
jgi:glycosyltransferase involved in cell wall biosynthesis